MQVPNVIDSQKSWITAKSGAMKSRSRNNHSEPDLDTQQGRATAIRLLHGHRSQISFARFLGVGYTAWNNFERGFPLSKSVEDKLTGATPGLSVDWLRYGDRRTLSFDLGRRLYPTQKGRS